MQSDRLDGRNSGKIRVDAWCDLICSPTVRSCLAGPKGGDVLHGPVNLAGNFFLFVFCFFDECMTKFKAEQSSRLIIQGDEKVNNLVKNKTGI